MTFPISLIDNGELNLSIRGKLNTAIGVIDITYANNSGTPLSSLAHRDGCAVNETYRVHFTDSNRQLGSSALFQCYTTTGALTPGDFTFVAGQGLVLEGTNARFKLVAGPGQLVDIRACGIVCDGATTGQMSKIARVISAAKDRGWKLTGGGTFMATETIDMRTCQCDWSMMKVQFGTRLDGTQSPTVLGDFCPDGDNPPSGVVVQSIIDFAGNTVKYGVGIRAGGNSKNSEKHEQKFFVWGDGNFDYTQTSTVIGVRWEDDDSAMAEYIAYTAYCAIGHGIQGPAEKHSIFAKVDYCNYGVFVLPNASADTLQVDLAGLNCRHYYTEAEGSDTSVELHINAEARDDPGDGSPTFYIRNGKNTRLSGRLRGQNGSECILVDRGTNSGADTFWMDFETINTYGTILHVHRLRALMGKLKCNLSRDAITNTVPAPMVWLERVINAGDFTVSGTNIVNTQAGIRIGDSTLYYPIESSFGPFSIQMGNLTTFSGTGNTPSGGHPTTFTALEVQKMVRGTIRMAQCGGQISIGADAQEVHLHLPAEAKRYTLTRNVASSVVLDYDGAVLPMDYPTGHTFTKYETGQSVTNFGATAIAQFFLPAAEEGLEFEFLVLDTDGLRVSANSGDTITLDADSPVSSISSTTLYSSVKLRAADADHWIAVNGNNRAAFSVGSSPPVNTVAASYTPTPPVDGDVVTYVPGTWTGATSVTWQWYLNGLASGNTATTIDTTDLGGQTLFVRETAVNGTGSATHDSSTAIIALPSIGTTQFSANLIAGGTPWYTNIDNVAFYDSTDQRTWIFWQAQSGGAGTAYHLLCRTYDHVLGNFSPELTIATNGLVDDNHGAPSAIMDADGYVIVAWGSHNTPEKFVSTTYPRDPSTWRALADGANGLSYPHLTRIGTNIFLGNRYTVAGAPRYFSMTPYTSALGVLTAGAAVTLIDYGVNTRFYQGTHVVVGNDIHLCGIRANDADTTRLNIYYYVVQTDGAGTITGVRNFDNTVTVLAAAFPMSLATAEASFKLYTHGGGTPQGTGVSMCIDTDGHPHVLFTAGAAIYVGPCDYLHIWHNGSAWQTPDTVFSGGNDPFICEAIPGASGKVELWYTNATTVARKTWQSGSIGAEEVMDRSPKRVLSGLAALRTVQVRSGIGYATGDSGQFTFSSAYTPVNSECASYFARLASPPNITKKYYIDRLFTVIKAIGISKFDAFWLHCMDIEADSLLNILGTSFSGTNNGATWTADRGFTTDGASTYVDLAYNYASGTAALQNSNHLATWCLNATGSGAAVGSTSGSGPWLNPRVTGSDDLSTRMSQSTTSTCATTISTPSFVLGNRSGSGAVQLYRQGAAVTISNSTQASVALSGTMSLGHAGGVFSTQRFMLTCVGGSLTSGEQSTLYLKGVYPLAHYLGVI